MNINELKSKMLVQLEWAKKSNCDCSYLLATYHMIIEIFPDMYNEVKDEINKLLEV